MAEKDQLDIPEPAKADPNSLELLRVWAANKQQYVSIRIGAWKDPAAWGLMLADLARHIVNAYEQDRGLDAGETLQRIKAGLDMELSSPTDKPTGHT
jgi:hypothetical protein